jgi:16S rRNA (cytidine1402-2'-O)-methyltransferase
MTEKGKFFLIPNFLGYGTKDDVAYSQLQTIYMISEFIVESEKSARAFLKAISHPLSQSEFVFHLLNEHTGQNTDLTPFFKSCLQGKSIGLISDAGIPCVADPGSSAVWFAHKNRIQVVPLSGPSSIYMSLMASGFQGQSFTFHGYLPIELSSRISKIHAIEKTILSNGPTQIFMETPYRNENLFQLLIKTLKPNTKLCIAANISQPGEYIQTLEVQDWKKSEGLPQKSPSIFLIGR